MRRRDLGLVDWDDGRQGANAQTGNDSAQHHHGHARCESLQGTANEEDHGPVEDRASAADDVADLAHQQRRYQRTDLENGDHGAYLAPRGLVEVITEVRAPGGEDTSQLRGLDRKGEGEGDGGDKVLRDNARHHALVISKEEHA